MAKSITSRSVPFMQSVPNDPTVRSSDIPFWVTPKGVNYMTRASRIMPNYLWDARDWIIVDGRFELRLPVAHQGAAAGRQCEVGIFVTTDGIVHTFFMTTGSVSNPGTVKYWNGSSWALPTGAPNLTGNHTNHLSYTAWNNKMVWTNGKDGIYEWDWTSQTVTEITTTYIPKFLTTFMSRIFMGDVSESGTNYPSRMRWSVKNNNLDLTGIGSGYEDFLSTPGGYVDRFQSMIPVNDVQAMVIKENSTWIVSETGDVDAPVRVGRQFATLGSKSPRSIVSVVGGALGLFNDGIYVVSESGIQNIGQQVIRRIQETVTDFDSCVGAYDNKYKRYNLSVYDDSLQQTVLYQYSFPDESWMPLMYPFRISSMQYASSPLVGLTFDTATGTFDAAVGTFDSEVGSPATSQLYIGGGTSDGYFVHHEVDTDDSTAIDPESTQAYLITGLLQAGPSTHKTTLLEVQIEYESDESVTATIEYSTDLGATWTTYSQGICPATTGPGIHRFVHVLTGHNIQLKFKVPLLTIGFRLLAFVPTILVSEEMQNQSSEEYTQIPFNPIP